MRVMMIGVSHQTAEIDLRDRLAMSGARLNETLDRVRALASANDAPIEVVIVSTCNRTELYIATPVPAGVQGDDVLGFISRSCDVPIDELRAAAIHREQDQAVAHLFRVCVGLESMVLGEPQVLGQVKRAYEAAVSRDAVGPVLHQVFQQAIATAKKVRCETEIDRGRVSIGSIAVDFARQIFERFDDKTIVAIGAGDMAKLTLRHLSDLRPAKLWVTNRSADRARVLADRLKPQGCVIGVRPFDDLDAMLTETDIAVTSTGSDEPILTTERLKSILPRRRHRPLFLIDLAVPRDIEPAAGSLRNVYLYNVDDLQRVAAGTHDQRETQAEECKAMLHDAVRSCIASVQHRDIGRLVQALRSRLHEIGQAEQARTERKLAAAAPGDLERAIPDVLEDHTRRLINKILHLPLNQLDHRQAGPSLGFYAAALRGLFDLDENSLDAAAPADVPPPPVVEVAVAKPSRASDPPKPQAVT